MALKNKNGESKNLLNFGDPKKIYKNSFFKLQNIWTLNSRGYRFMKIVTSLGQRGSCEFQSLLKMLPNKVTKGLVLI